MNRIVAIAQFELQTKWFLAELENISDEQSNKQGKPDLNPLKWVVGHVLNTRMTLINLLSGTTPDQNFNKLFGKGSSAKIDLTHPAMDEIILKWGLVSADLAKCLEKLTSEALLSPPPFQTSIPDKTLHGLIAYMVSHEAYHLGQLSVLKKLV